MSLTRKLLLILLFLHPSIAICQHKDSLAVNKRGLRIAAISAGAAYGVALAGLHTLWYEESGKQSFEFFNDNKEWKQVDKLGHFYSAYYISYGTSRGLQHYNVKPSKADLIGAITGFAVLLPIEIFDGFSEAYGASAGDIVADGAGALFYLGQKRLWSEIRIHPKFSFHSTNYAAFRPELLGSGSERIIKDYNGQTYWFSFDLDKFFRFPKWMNIALGYGANGMVYAHDYEHVPNGFPTPYRQFYIALDPDLTAIQTRSKVVRTILFFANMIKIPAPTLEITGNGSHFHAFYF